MSGSIPKPAYLTAFGGCEEYVYFVPGHDPAEVYVIDDASALVWEPIWMRPQRVSTLDEMERDPYVEALTRDERGRFAPAYCWMICGESDPEAEPWLGVNYAQAGSSGE